MDLRKINMTDVAYVKNVLKGRTRITSIGCKNGFIKIFYVDRNGNNSYCLTDKAYIPRKEYDMSDVFGF